MFSVNIYIFIGHYYLFVILCFRLLVKRGCTLICQKNLDMRAGVCNGTRLGLEAASRHALTCRILMGELAGQIVLIPRILIEHNGVGTAVKFTRRQFPVRLAFCITMHKSQGQTLDKVGIYLPIPPFVHGQFYTSVSRAKTAADVSAYIKEGPKQGKTQDGTYFTQNVVNKDLLREAAPFI